MSYQMEACPKQSNLWKITYKLKRLVCYDMDLFIFIKTTNMNDLLGKVIRVVKENFLMPPSRHVSSKNLYRTYYSNHLKMYNP